MSALTKVKARDLMQTKVITLPAGASIREAIETFEDERITGVPVVDSGGQVIGMLTARDVARAEHVHSGRIDSERGDLTMASPREEAMEETPLGEDAFYSREDYSTEVLGEETVGDWMRPGSIAVTPETSLRDVCRTMMSEGIHRVLVLRGQRLEGIVTTTDVVRYLAENL
jgi:CBS domain-containing protein